MTDLVPAGDPLSRSVIAANDLKGIAGHVLEAIDMVHGDGQLPVIPARFTSSHTSGYAEANYYYHSLMGEAVEIQLSPDAETPELSLLHEIGHFVDHKGLDFQFFLTSPNAVTVEEMGVLVKQTIFASETNPVLSDWREAVLATDAVIHLEGLRNFRSATVIAADGRPISLSIDQSYVNYLLEFRELFARSYAQYVVTNSQSRTMQHQINNLRQEPLASLYPLYWQEDEFLSIADTLDDVLRKRGWLR